MIKFQPQRHTLPSAETLQLNFNDCSLANLILGLCIAIVIYCPSVLRYLKP